MWVLTCRDPELPGGLFRAEQHATIARVLRCDQRRIKTADKPLMIYHLRVQVMESSALWASLRSWLWRRITCGREAIHVWPRAALLAAASSGLRFWTGFVNSSS